MVNFDDLITKGQFKDGGRGPYEFDCWGLAREVYRRYGIDLPDYRISAYDTEKIGRKITDSLPEYVEVKPPLPVPCLVGMRMNTQYITHVGVYIGDGKYIQAYAASGVCITRIYDPGWRGKIAGYYVPRG